MQKRKRKAIKVVTLGCSKNTVDSEKLLVQFRANGYHVSTDHSDKEVPLVLINTCGFIRDAKEESIDMILGYVEEKRKGNVEKVFVMGCLAQRYKDELIREIPEIDGIFGVNDHPAILRNLGADYKTELLGERVLTTPSHVAYLKISEGCDRQCSFCAIPLIRGKYVSRPENELLAEAGNLIAGGVRELILIAQDLTYYGLDLYKRRTLPALADKMAGLPGLEWLRLHYTYPAGFPPDLLDVVNGHPTICKYVDIPIQHINDRVLTSMRRGMTGKKTIHLLETIRKKIPGVAIRTTLITGYPCETEKEFDELVHFIRHFKFDRLGVFTYSHEEDTPAWQLKDDIPAKIKKQRADEIMSVQEQISYDLNKCKIGKVFKVIIDREEHEYYIGRTESDSPEIDNEVLIVKDGVALVPGNFYPIRITEVNSFDIFGSCA